MRTSPEGIAFLERHEGVVLKAYRDPVGIWTIGAGLTRASGVVAPRAGMVITRKDASRLLLLALERNYETAVAEAMPDATQQEFDGGVSFHFNTGAIGRASWVKSWRRRDWPGVQVNILKWRKGGGKVLPGLERRRREEFALIRRGDYGAPVAHRPGSKMAREVVAISPEENAQIREALVKLGYEDNPNPIGISEAAIRAFQRNHDLTVDGIIGRATLSTLQRRIDAKRKGATAATTSGTALVGTEAFDTMTDIAALPEGATGGAAVLGALWLGKIAWSYRDVIAAKTHSRFPAFARFLRSF